MPGPIPKDPALRQRRNKSASRAVLMVVQAPRLRTPRLPKIQDGDKDIQWHPMAKEWWRDVWASPMHFEFLRGDEPALIRLFFLVDRFWKSGSLNVAKEIRLMEREFGLTPLSRRRLEWSVTQAEEAKDRHEMKRSRRAIIIDGDDPREVLSK